MKLIIAGSRSIDKSIALDKYYQFIQEKGDLKITELVTGGCAFGPDQIPLYICMVMLNPYKLTKFPADWNRHGRAAGPIRNRQMAEYADELLLIWDGKSRGSRNMKEEMEKLGKPVYEIVVES